MTTAQDNLIARDAPIQTWFGVGGGADALARPASLEELGAVLERFAGQPIRVLGDAANLLVDDAGVDGLVISLERMSRVEWPVDGAAGVVRAQGGAKLPPLILEAVRRGLAGVEGLAGVPASMGGAVVMNAGGAFGEIGDVVERVEVMDHNGGVRTLHRDEIDFGYRRSGLGGSIVTAVELRLAPGDPAALRSRLKDVMARKKHSQPMAERCAGCAFKNPVIAGERISAGRLIDEAGCKGLRIGGAEVSHVHANFIITRDSATARDVIGVMEEVQRRVLDRFGVALEREVVIWRREDAP